MAGIVKEESNETPTTCPKCRVEFPLFLADFDEIDAFRCTNCDALFEHGEFVCYGPKPH
jgi:hypothetical protein